MKVNTYQSQAKVKGFSFAPLKAENKAGQYIGAGMQNLAKGMDKYRERANDIVTTDAMTSLKKEMNNLMYGEKGWINDKGENAIYLRERGTTVYQMLVDKLGERRAKARF